MLKMKHLYISIFLLLYPIVFAGSNDAKITGITSSNRTEVKVIVGDISGIIREVSLKIDGKSYTFIPDKCTVIKDDKNKIYILIANNKKYNFKMWMVPGSEKIISKTSGSLHTTFTAIIEASDPRKNDKWSITPRITIGCNLNYSI